MQICPTNSVIFKDDFLIQKEKYTNHSPDLIIISPKVMTYSNRTIIIDLSCRRHPGYPDGGRTKAGNGEDGKPGRPGFNRRNLLIISESIPTSLNFISNGGIGGNGQEGKTVDL